MNWNWFVGRWNRIAAVIAVLVGLGFIIGGWVGISGSNLTTEQIPYLASGAVGGLFALGLGASLWLSADLRDEYRKLDDIYNWCQSGGFERLAQQTSVAFEQVERPQPDEGEYFNHTEEVPVVASTPAPAPGSAKSRPAPARRSRRASTAVE